MASIGQELRRERELRGITLKEIADSTKINIRFLRALEEDRIDMLPEKFFTRGIIRSYAKYLGLDEQGALNTYLEDVRSQQKPEGPSQEKKPKESGRQEKAPKEKKTSWLSVVMVLIIIGLIIIMYFVLRQDGNAPEDPVVESLLQDTQVEPSRTPLMAQKKPMIEQEGLNLEIEVQQETWIEIYADQTIVDSGIKVPGERLRFKARKEFLIHIGNAGGIAYTINGEQGIKFGEAGAVIRDIRISLDNYRDYIVKNQEL